MRKYVNELSAKKPKEAEPDMVLFPVLQVMAGSLLSCWLLSWLFSTWASLLITLGLGILTFLGRFGVSWAEMAFNRVVDWLADTDRAAMKLGKDGQDKE